MGQFKERFYRESQQEAHLEPHPLEESLEETVFELRSILDEVGGKCPKADDPEFASYLAYVDVFRDMLQEAEEKLAKMKAK